MFSVLTELSLVIYRQSKLWGGVMGHMFLFLKTEILFPNVMVLGDGAFAS